MGGGPCRTRPELYEVDGVNVRSVQAVGRESFNRVFGLYRLVVMLAVPRPGINVHDGLRPVRRPEDARMRARQSDFNLGPCAVGGLMGLTDAAT